MKGNAIIRILFICISGRGFHEEDNNEKLINIEEYRINEGYLSRGNNNAGKCGGGVQRECGYDGDKMKVRLNENNACGLLKLHLRRGGGYHSSSNNPSLPHI